MIYLRATGLTRHHHAVLREACRHAAELLEDDQPAAASLFRAVRLASFRADAVRDRGDGRPFDVRIGWELDPDQQRDPADRQLLAVMRAVQIVRDGLSVAPVKATVGDLLAQLAAIGDERRREREWMDRLGLFGEGRTAAVEGPDAAA